MRPKIENFLLNLDTEIDIISTVDIYNIDYSNAFDNICNMIEENSGFDIEIVYYHKAMDFLAENDPSLRKSLEIAHECGFELPNLDSEVLASLLASKIAREEFYQLEDEINDFFRELKKEKAVNWNNPDSILTKYGEWLSPKTANILSKL